MVTMQCINFWRPCSLGSSIFLIVHLLFSIVLAITTGKAAPPVPKGPEMTSWSIGLLCLGLLLLDLAVRLAIGLCGAKLTLA